MKILRFLVDEGSGNRHLIPPSVVLLVFLELMRPSLHRSTLRRLRTRPLRSSKTYCRPSISCCFLLVIKGSVRTIGQGRLPKADAHGSQSNKRGGARASSPLVASTELPHGVWTKYGPRDPWRATCSGFRQRHGQAPESRMCSF